MTVVTTYTTITKCWGISTYFTAKNSNKFTDDFVNYKINQAERWVNTICGTSFTGTIPDDIVTACEFAAKLLMDNELVKGGYFDPKFPIAYKPEETIYSLLKQMLEPRWKSTGDNRQMWIKKG